MTDRENLVELINYVCEGHAENLMQPYGVETLADHLIANGVTVQEWVSVEERMPNPDTEVLVLTSPGTLSVGQNWRVAEYIHPSGEKYGVFIDFHAEYRDENMLEVTHWMPLPEPPKGE